MLCDNNVEPLEASSQKTLNPEETLLTFANEDRCNTNSVLCDFKIKAGNIVFPAHRLVLSSRSDYFKRMFNSKMKEQHQNYVEIHEFTDIFKQLLDCMYTGTDQVDINNQNVAKFLAAARYYQMNSLKIVCCEYLVNLVNNIKVDDCIPILSEVYKTLDKSTHSIIVDFIVKNLMEVSDTDNFKSLKENEIDIFLKTVNECGAKHKALYFALIRWVKHSVDRKCLFKELFKLLPSNGSRLSTDFIRDTVLNEKLVKDCSECFELASDMLEHQTQGFESNDQKHLLSLGGEGGYGKKVKYVYTALEHQSISQRPYPALPFSVERHCAVNFNQHLYCTGGHKSDISSNDFDSDMSFNFSEKGSIKYVLSLDLNNTSSQWQPIAEMNHKRRDFAAAIFQSHIVVVGGNELNVRTSNSTVEVYMPEKKNGYLFLPYRLLEVDIVQWYAKVLCMSLVEKIKIICTLLKNLIVGMKSGNLLHQ